MRMRLPMIACLLSLAPVAAHAQGLPVDFDERYADSEPAEAAAANEADHPPSTTETSPAHARVVRHGERTVKLIGNGGAAGSAKLIVASAGPVGS